MSNDKDIVGWGSAGAAWAVPEARTVSRAVVAELGRAGVRDAFGVLGGGIAPFSAALAQSAIRFHHFRHEAGAGFAAIENHFETGRPALVVVTTGPGLFNVLNAVMAARMDSARLLLISGFTARQQVGRGAVQETSFATMPAEVLRPGSLFHDVAIPEVPDELFHVMGRFRRGLSGPGGFVAHLGLPLSMQMKSLEQEPTLAGEWTIHRPGPTERVIDECLEMLMDDSALLWIGHGARGSRRLVEFAERSGLPVVCSPRGKGIFPETHPLFVGVSGAGGSPAVKDFFASQRPRHVLVVGTRLGEVTSFLAPGLSPSQSWLHVDLDPTAFGAAFPNVRGCGIVSDASVFFDALHARAEATGWYERRPKPPVRASEIQGTALAARDRGEVRPPFLMQVLQRRVVEESDALVMSEAGTSFTWCNAHLRFSEEGRYRTSAAWGSMGHFTTGCVGAALAGRRKVVAVVGDGAMLMNNEINTAVQYQANVLWVVLNDAQLGLNEHGMTALGMRPVETQMPRTDFVAFARSQGAEGITVSSEEELDAALVRALAQTGPVVLDVAIDRTIPSPVVAERIKSLQRQASQVIH